MDHIITIHITIHITIFDRRRVRVKVPYYFRSITEAITLPSAACYILIILLFSGVYVSGIWGERKEANVFGSFFYSQWISLAFWCTLCLILIIFCLLSSVVSRVMICCPWDSTRMDHLFSSVGIKAWLYIYYGLSSRMVKEETPDFHVITVKKDEYVLDQCLYKVKAYFYSKTKGWKSNIWTVFALVYMSCHLNLWDSSSV